MTYKRGDWGCFCNFDTFKDYNDSAPHMQGLAWLFTRSLVYVPGSINVNKKKFFARCIAYMVIVLGN